MAEKLLCQKISLWVSSFYNKTENVVSVNQKFTSYNISHFTAKVYLDTGKIQLLYFLSSRLIGTAPLNAALIRAVTILY